MVCSWAHVHHAAGKYVDSLSLCVPNVFAAWVCLYSISITQYNACERKIGLFASSRKKRVRECHTVCPRGPCYTYFALRGCQGSDREHLRPGGYIRRQQPRVAPDGPRRTLCRDHLCATVGCLPVFECMHTHTHTHMHIYDILCTAAHPLHTRF